ncbi:MAG: M50 family metallopeptidase [Patescibacteria group bacterium]
MTIIIFIIILGVLVLAHEFGHFIVAKKFGVKVEEFAFGFPPTLWSKKKGDTTYMINLIPFGGYVKLFGEDGSHVKDEKSFAHRAWWQRAFIIIAGIIMNLILGGVCLAIAFIIGLPIISDQAASSYPYAQISQQILVYEIKAGSAAENVLQEGDEILALNGEKINDINEFKNTIQTMGVSEANLTIQRKKQTINISLPIEYSAEDNSYQLGTYLVAGQIVKYPFYLAIPMGFVEMIRILGAMIVAFYVIIRDLIISFQAPSQIAGPVGIYKIAATASELGLVYLIQLTAILNINLAIINLLPIPALDGGRLFFIIIEKIRGKKISDQIENLIHTAGFLVIIGLIILVTISDIKKFF